MADNVRKKIRWDRVGAWSRDKVGANKLDRRKKGCVRHPLQELSLQCGKVSSF